MVWLSAFTLLSLVAIGIFGKNGWLPNTDALTGKKTGWFKSEPPALAGGLTPAGNPAEPQLPNATPQLSKEFVYAGSRLLAVEDANASAAPPADLAVWRPSTGTWWVMGGPASQQTTQSWGINGDEPVPGDFDGDGKTDFSIFRPSTGEWFVLQSSNNAWMGVLAWGLSTDKRVAADFDGDGRTDRAIWRPGDGTWYIQQSSTQSAVYQTFGTNGDIPTPADFDGDGRADPSNSATPVSGDYDGDGIKLDKVMFTTKMEISPLMPVIELLHLTVITNRRK